MKTWIVDAKLTLRPVCTLTHEATSKKCNKNHGVPPSAVWSGPVPQDELGDLRIDLRNAKRKHRTALRQWERQRQRLLMARAAPAFTQFRKELLQKHETEKPRFTFTWSALGNSNGGIPS